ncbi:MAG: radical SAM protein, partial [Clostridia bacterium]|nr:radical SAM protein [Clostridia bacterium]
MKRFAKTRTSVPLAVNVPNFADFISSLAKKCKENGISVAIDTAGAVPFESFEKVLPFADYFLYDIKCITPETHEKFTGMDNRLILENFEKLLKTGTKIIVRVPLIAGFNDGEETEKIKAYLLDKNVPVEYLPYHEFGVSKLKAI